MSFLRTLNIKLNLFIFISLVLQVKCEIIYCNDNKLIDNKNCVPEIDLYVTNTTIGKANLTFKTIIDCDFNDYKIILNINENIQNKNDCENESFNNGNWLKHEENKIYQFDKKNNISLPSCSQFQFISTELSEMYTGCYKITLKSIKNFEENITTITKYLTTNYIKNYVNFSMTENNNDINYNFTIQIHNLFTSNSINFECNLYDTTELFHWKMYCFWDGKCNISESQNISVKCDSKYRKFQIIECSLQNIKEGNFSLKMELINEDEVRCFGGDDSVWSKSLKPCGKIFNLEIKHKENTAIIVEDSNSNQSNFIIIIIVTLLLVIIVCIFLTLYIRHRSVYISVAQENTEMTEYDEMKENFEIFLLYARDCNLMNETMTELKHVLENTTNCNVYDIYDPDFEQTISLDPSDWLISLLSRPEDQLKIILVESLCGDLILREPTLDYTRPRFTDKLFLQGIQILKDKLHRVFVLNLKLDNVTHTTLSCFSPGVRYTLPDQLDRLVQVLGGTPDQEMVSRFSRKYQELDRFVKNNPKYYTNVLNVKIEFNDTI